MTILDFTPRDAGMMAWAVVGLCLVASFLAFGLQGRTTGRERAFWLVVLVVMLGLGVNKQLDLQTEMTRFVRALARAQGWYGQRRTVQLVVIGALGLAVLAGSAWLVQLTRRQSAGVRIATVGMLCLAGFVLVRAASFHHFDVALRTMVAGTKLYNLVELGGAVLVVAGGLLAWVRTRR